MDKATSRQFGWFIDMYRLYEIETIDMTFTLQSSKVARKSLNLWMISQLLMFDDRR